MPNYVTNKIEFHGEQENVKKVLELIKGEDDYIDFDRWFYRESILPLYALPH